eukprot:2860050-Alexandrium_andersonii.AAC.1
MPRRLSSVGLGAPRSLKSFMPDVPHEREHIEHPKYPGVKGNNYGHLPLRSMELQLHARRAVACARPPRPRVPSRQQTAGLGRGRHATRRPLHSSPRQGLG